MPNWKKVIVSGSDASLSNLHVINAVTASYFAGDGSALTGISADVTETATISDTFSSTTSKVVTHNFNTKNVIITVYNDSDQQILPASITTTDNNTATIAFDSATSGRVVVAKGGHLVSGSISYEDIANNPFTSTTNQITASGHLVPSVHETYDLGSSSLRWRDLYLSGSTIDLGGTRISRDSGGNVEFSDSQGTLKTLKVAELEIGTGSKKIKLKIDDNDKVKFEDSDTGTVEAPTFYKENVTGSSSYTITHSLDEDYPIVQVYGTDKRQFIPKDIVSNSSNIVTVSFSTNFTGQIVVKK